MKDRDEIIDRAEKILKGKSIDGYEIFIDESSEFEVESKEEKVDTLQASHSWGMAFRVLHRQRTGFSFTTFPCSFLDSNKDVSDVIKQVIEDAIASAKVTSQDPCLDFAPMPAEPLPHLPISDGSLTTISEKEKIEKAKQLEEATRSVDPKRIKKVRKASYQEGLSKRTLINSRGLRYTYDTTLASVSVTAIAEDSGESEMGWEFDYSHFFKDLDVEKTGRSAGRKALERLGGRRIASGSYPVLLRNHIASEFLSLLAHSFLSDQIQKGKSSLRGKKGEKMFSPLLSIVDDGLLPKGISTSPIDGEGMPSRRTSLVAGGVLSGYLYDRYWANRENAGSSASGAASTGNSRRSGIKSPPGIGVSNFFIEPGKIATSELLKDFQRGLAVEEVMGLHTVDPISGEFSLGCSGDWVENGKICYPVKSIAIAGNLFELFKKVVGIGEDLRFFGGVGAPSLFIESLAISGN